MRAATSEIIVLLNNDTEAEAGWLAALVCALDSNPRAGMAASKLRLFDEREKIHSAGDYYRVDGIPGNRGVWQVDRGQFDTADASPVLFGVCGGACAYRKTMLDEIGLFDEDFWNYCEDVDLNWRARLAGYDCAYAPKAVVYHMLSATGAGPLASFHVGRNTIYVLVKDYPASLWKQHRTKILRAQLGIAFDALKNIRGESARARLRGQLAGLLALPRLFKKRRAVQATRRVSDQELMQILAGQEHG
jgi:GT2 family glycosyltransferase